MSGVLGPPAPTPATRTTPSAHRLPGGAVVTETWTGVEAATIAIAGELDAFDRTALVDALTATILDGARQIVLDATAVSFADTAVLHALDQVRRHLHRDGGCLVPIGLDALNVSRLLPSASSTGPRAMCAHGSRRYRVG